MPMGHDRPVIRSRLTVGMLRAAIAGLADDAMVVPIGEVESPGVDMDEEAPLLAILDAVPCDCGIGIVVQQSYIDDDADWLAGDDDEEDVDDE